MAEPPDQQPTTGSETHKRNQALNAVSFGFIATAVLFAMFLTMAIFERILRPRRHFRNRGAVAMDIEQVTVVAPSPSVAQKPELRHVSSYSKAVSVVMPGDEYPTYFARPIVTPVDPEGVQWPSHAESSQNPSNERR